MAAPAKSDARGPFLYAREVTRVSYVRRKRYGALEDITRAYRSWKRAETRIIHTYIHGECVLWNAVRSRPR